MVIINSGVELDAISTFILLGSSIAIFIYAIWLVISVFNE